jgi:ABC-type thiamine transport system ATPase subunit
MSWRGVSLSALLNTPIAEILPLLRALPRAMDAMLCLEALCLTHLPLGMPLSLMSDSELHRLLLIQALLSATASRPIIALVESPFSSLSAQQRDGALRLFQTASRANHLSIVMV